MVDANINIVVAPSSGYAWQVKG